MRQLITATFTLIISATLSLAEESKFIVEGNTLFYNTENPNLVDDYVTYSDASSFRTLLVENPEISVIDLNSFGGLIEAGLEISRIIADFDVDTKVSGECSSACVLIFLAGRNRQLNVGGLLGFHRPNWTAGSMQKHYDEYKAEEGWGNTFDFSNWLMEDTYFVAGQMFKVYADAGIDINFVASTLSIKNDQMWYPSRRELAAAGLLDTATVASARPRARPSSLATVSYNLSSNAIK